MSHGVGSSKWSAPSKLRRNLDLASLRPVPEGVNRDAEAPEPPWAEKNRRTRNLIGSCSLPYECRGATGEGRISLEGKQLASLLLGILGARITRPTGASAEEVARALHAKRVEEALVELAHRWNRVGDRERWPLKRLSEGAPKLPIPPEKEPDHE